MKLNFGILSNNSDIIRNRIYKVYYRKSKSEMHQIVVDSILGPHEKIEKLKKNLITALNSINQRMRQKQFIHSKYVVDWYQKQEEAQKQVRKNSFVSTKQGSTTKFNKLTFKSVKQRNSFPRAHKNYKNIYQKLQSESFYQKKDNQKEQHARKGRIILNICKLENSYKFPKPSQKQQKDESSFTLNQMNLSRVRSGNQQINKKHSQQQNLLIVNRLRNSLKVNKKILNEKAQKLQKSLNMKVNSMPIGRSFGYLDKKTDYSMQKLQKPDMQLCRWEQQQKQNCLDTPAFDM